MPFIHLEPTQENQHMKTNSPSAYFVLFVFLALWSCNQAKDPKTKLEEFKNQANALNDSIQRLQKLVGGDTSQIRYSQVSFSPLMTKDFVHTIDVQGKVESDQNIEVNPKTMGIVTEVNVTEGQAVKQGQVLARIDNQLLKGNLEQLKSQYSLATILYQKQKNLWDQQIGTEVQYLQAKNSKENLEKNMAVLQDQLSQTNIVSPISGTVDQVMARVGQMAAIGAPQFRIVNANKIKVTAGLGENYISQVGVGSQVNLSFPDAGKMVKAKISFVSSVIDPVTRTFTVQTKLQGETGIKPNMIAIFKIQDYHNPNAMVIPVNVVQNSEEGSFVYVIEKGNSPGHGIARKKLIKTGLIQGDMIEVKQGLKVQDLLVTVGYQGLTDGAPLSF